MFHINYVVNPSEKMLSILLISARTPLSSHGPSFIIIHVKNHVKCKEGLIESGFKKVSWNVNGAD